MKSTGRRVAFLRSLVVSAFVLATCLHVIQSAARLRIVVADGKQNAVHGIFGTDRLLDTAVLWVTNAPASLKGLQLRATPLEISERVFVLGSSDRLPFRAAKGTVTARGTIESFALAGPNGSRMFGNQGWKLRSSRPALEPGQAVELKAASKVRGSTRELHP